MVNSVTTSMTCGTHFIPLSTQLSIIKWTLMFLMKSSINQLPSGCPFSKEEFKIAIANCNNASISGPDKLL